MPRRDDPPARSARRVGVAVAVAVALGAFGGGLLVWAAPTISRSVRDALDSPPAPSTIVVAAPPTTVAAPAIDPLVPAITDVPTPATTSTTTSPPAVPVRLAVAGDVGTGEAEEFATAAAMDALEGEVEYRALILLGDNIYEDGDPSKAQTHVFDPFAGVLDGGTELLPVLGNHDVNSGFGDAQIAALGMPGRWYSTVYPTEFGDVEILSLDSNRPDDPDQLAWLEETLATSTATWKIATMHHPPYSGGFHGSSRNVRRAFSPLFEQYGVQLVLSGHDHDYQRSVEIGGVTYVVSGGAARLRDTGLADFSVAALSVYHFVDIAITSDGLHLRAVDQRMGVIDEVLVAP